MTRFFSKVRKSRGCWNWTASLTHAGYGQFALGGSPRLAHRVSWELHFGTIPSGMFVCHKCDNPRCVRPDHLFLGTPKDNVRDMLDKGRGVHTGPRPGNGPDAHPERYSRGSAHMAAKLTEADVIEMRRRNAEGVTTVALAAEFGVSQSAAWNAISKKTWRHI